MRWEDQIQIFLTIRFNSLIPSPSALSFKLVSNLKRNIRKKEKILTVNREAIMKIGASHV